jgi:hypothetical protein
MSNEQEILAAFGATKVDDIDVIPGFRTPPSGNYDASAEFELKVVNGDPAFIIKFELATDDTEAPPRFLKGDQFSVMFKGKQGLEYGRDTIAMVFDELGVTTMQEAVDNGSVSANITIKSKADKNDPDTVYASLKKFELI